MIGVSPHLARVMTNDKKAPKSPKRKNEKGKKNRKDQKNILSLHWTPLWYCTVSLPFISPFCLLHIQTSTSTYTHIPSHYTHTFSFSPHLMLR